MVLAEFIAKISRLNPKRYVIYIPSAVQPLAKKLHGAQVKVILVEPEASIYPIIKIVKSGDIVVDLRCNNHPFIVFTPVGQRIATELFGQLKHEMEFDEFLVNLAVLLRMAKNEEEKNLIADVIDNLVFCFF